jgi:transglutaminase-like putative cysteine protease
VEWNEIPKADLELKSFNSDTSVSAMVLCSYGEARINDNLGIDYNVHMRIKIFTPAGYEHGTVVLGLYTKGDAEQISDLKGATYTLDGSGEIVRTKLEKNMIFEEEIDNTTTRFRFTLPALKPGCVIEYRYKIVRESWFHISSWTFQKSIPVRWSEFRAIIPMAMAYARLLKGYERFAVKEETEVFQPFSGGAHGYFGSSPVRCTQYRWVMRDLPAFTEEAYITAVSDYASSVEMQLGEYALPGGGSRKVLKTWDAVIKELLDDKEFGDMAEPNGRVRDLTATVIVGKEKPIEKLSAMYDYVRNTIVWDGNRRVFGGGSVKDVLESKKGSSADINLLLAAMLRSAGIDAHPVILSTRANGQVTETYPMLSPFNTTVVRAKASGNDYVLDATDPLRKFDLIPTSILNVRGLVIRPGAVEWITITSPKRYVHRTAAMLTVDTTGEVHGTLESSDEEYSALAKRRDLREKKPIEIARDIFSTEKTGLTLDSVTVTGQDSVDGPLKISAQGIGASYAQVSGDFIYINPAVVDRLTSSPFKLKDRKFPVDMSYKRAFVTSMNLKIPAGYEVKELPWSVRFSVGPGDATYTRESAAVGGMIQVVMRMTINATIFQPSSYSSLKEFYEKIVTAESDQIVLKKLQALPPAVKTTDAAPRNRKPGKPAKGETKR